VPVLQSSLWFLFPRFAPASAVEPAGSLQSLPAPRARCIWVIMTSVFALMINLDDRVRLRERFFGATRTVLARR